MGKNNDHRTNEKEKEKKKKNSNNDNNNSDNDYDNDHNNSNSDNSDNHQMTLRIVSSLPVISGGMVGTFKEESSFSSSSPFGFSLSSSSYSSYRISSLSMTWDVMNFLHLLEKRNQ